MNQEHKYSEHFDFGADEKYIADLINKILLFYRTMSPLSKRDINLVTKYRDQEGEGKYYITVAILEPNNIITEDCGETAAELIVGKGETIHEALENIYNHIKYNCYVRPPTETHVSGCGELKNIIIEKEV